MAGWDTLISSFEDGFSSVAPASRVNESSTTTPEYGGGWGNLVSSFSPSPVVNESFVVSGLVKRGMPEHIARGFAMNFKSESNFNPGINEINPTVPGSRGGFGLAQWTGPRRRKLESFAQDSGRDVSDPDMQLDFLMQELAGDERSAARHIYNTQDAGSAGAEIVNRFLRPRADFRANRASEYLAAPLPTSNRLWLNSGD